MTIVVTYTVRHRRLLTRRQYRVPLIAVLTLASGVAGYNIRFTFLISAAYHFAAGIHAVTYATVHSEAERTWLTVRVTCTSRYHGLGRLATFHKIARITLIAIDTQAGGYVVLSDAQCVRSALQFTARVNAFSNAFANLETNLLECALKIVQAVTL